MKSNNLQDVSLLIIKPEAFGRRYLVLDSLRNKGYNILTVKEMKGWAGYIPKIYVEFTEEQKNEFVDAYLESKFSSNFIAIIATHKKGNTIQRLIKDVGNFATYQKKSSKSLRSEFGLPKEHNIVCPELTVVFNGLHKINDIKDFYKHLLMFDISWPV